MAFNTWSTFLTYYGLFAVVYWFCAGFFLYRRETFHRSTAVRGSTSSLRPEPNLTPSSDEEETGQETPAANNHQYLHLQAESLTDEVDAFLAALQDEEPWHKDRITDQLRKLIRKYPSLKGTVYPASVNEHIFERCQALDISTITMGDIEQIWC